MLFPGAGLLVLSAWCLGVLNSHRRFLLSYAAPVMWNAAMIATLVVFGASTPLPRLAVLLAWGSVAGSALQFAVQLPAVLRVAPGLRFAIDRTSVHVRQVVTNFVPVFVGRGVVQISAFIDTLIASLLPTGAVTGLANAQLLYTLPVSLFGMSVAAAELPAMAVAGGRDGSARDALRQRLQDGLRRIAFFVVPSAIAFLALGDVIAAALLQTGRFRSEDAVYVWGILAGSALGLLATTLGRLYSSAYYALHDTRTPLAFAIIRIFVSTILGYFLAVPRSGGARSFAVMGSGRPYCFRERGRLDRAAPASPLAERADRTHRPAAGLRRDAVVPGPCGGGRGVGRRTVLPPLHPAIAAAAILGPFGALYLGGTLWRGIPEATALSRRIRSRR